MADFKRFLFVDLNAASVLPLTLNEPGPVARHKMILRVLLLIIFTCCVCGTFVVNVKQSSYQAEENQNITLEWTFTTTADTSPNDISVYCEMSTDYKASVLFRLHKGAEVRVSQDKQFAGRVHWDKDVLREGQFRLHVSRLKIEDSGLYVCEVGTSYSKGFVECRLNVSAARDQPEPETPNTASQGRSALYWSLGLIAAAAMLFICYRFLIHLLPHEQDFYPEFDGGSEISFSEDDLLC